MKIEGFPRVSEISGIFRDKKQSSGQDTSNKGGEDGKKESFAQFLEKSLKEAGKKA